MISIGDKPYRTIEDAAKEFKVSSKTVGEWIKRGIIDRPPEIEYGVRSVRFFTAEYLSKAKADVRRYRNNQKKKG
jgi:hypothetical protein